MNYKYNRWQRLILEKALLSRRVLLLTGPRQCGKTTLATELAAGHHVVYRTLDNVTLLEAALTDPHGFVAHGDELMIIDEIQRAPLLLQAIKQDVDINQLSGRFLLTGSANIQSLPSVKESLAGRIRKIRLRPLAQGEIQGKLPDFLPRIFSKDFDSFQSNPPKHLCQDKNAYIVCALKGGYPEALLLDEQEKHRWYCDYLEALIEHDLNDIVNIRRQDSMRDLLHVLAAWSSKLIDISAIGTGLSLARQTIISYVNALEALYLIERVRPWTKTDYARVNQKDKFFMTDTGLMTAILRWQFDKIHLDGEKNGKLLETFVFTQLAAHLDASEEAYQLMHYRDREQREIDFIIENPAGNILGIEVKAGSLVNHASFKHLKWFQENMTQQNNFIGVVLYTGEHVIPFGKNLWALPINSLWT